MNKIILTTFIALLSLNLLALDCNVSTDSNGDGNFDHVIIQASNIVDQDMIFIFKDGSAHRQSNIAIGSEVSFSLESNKFDKSLEGTRIIAFGRNSSNVAVIAKHVKGTKEDFISTSATAFDFNAAFGFLIDYTTNTQVSCFK